jgi:tRNA pseudouridine38-40 synthase
VREIYKLQVERQGDYVIINARANAFLYHMVRNIAGVLIAIGIAKQRVDWAQRVLEAKNRAVAGTTAPAEGLYLVNVEYPERFEIPSADLLNFHLPA